MKWWNGKEMLLRQLNKVGMYCLLLLVSSTIDSRGATRHYTLSYGREFSLQFSQGLVFHLLPYEDGWVAQVKPLSYPKDKFSNGAPDFASVTPPFHGPNAADIQGQHFRNSDNTGPNELGPKNVNAPGKIRQIQYCSSVKEFLNWQKEYDDYQSGRCLQSSKGCFSSLGCRQILTLEIYDLRLTNLIAGQQARIERMEFSIDNK